LAYKNVDRKLPAKGLAKLGWLTLIAGLWIPTYWVAARFNFHPDLMSLVPGYPVYLPGQVIYWAMDWAQYYPRVFIPALMVVAVSMVAFIAISRKSRAKA
jgi:hypothetical protein